MTGDWYAPLTEPERDTLRHFLHRGNQAAYKLAAFAAPSLDLWQRAMGAARDVAEVHTDLCAAPGRADRHRLAGAVMDNYVCCKAEIDPKNIGSAWLCTLPEGHVSAHEARGSAGNLYFRWDDDDLPDDPPEYDPYDAAADQAEDHAAAQRELAAIEAEEAHDAAGEAWQAGAYPSGVTDPAETSGPRGLA